MNPNNYMQDPSFPDEDEFRLRQLDLKKLKSLASQPGGLTIYFDSEQPDSDKPHFDSSGVLTWLKENLFLLESIAYQRGARLYPMAILSLITDGTLSGAFTFSPIKKNEDLINQVYANKVKYIDLIPRSDSYLKYNLITY